MKLRIFVATALVAMMATLASAQLSGESLQWGLGPHQFLLTKEEAATWKTLTTDAEAKAFIALFWARRDPTPETPRNEYREQIAERIRYADTNLAGKELVPGSMTDRGKALLIFGLPKRIERSAAPNTAAIIEMGRDLQNDQRDSQTWIKWIYEDDTTRDVFNVGRATLRFVDKLEREEYKLERSSLPMPASEQRAIARTIKSPNLTTPPVFAEAAPVAGPAAPVVQTALKTAAFQSAVAALKEATANPYDKKAYLTWGEYVTSYGEYFVPVSLYVPAASGISGDVTFFGVVEDASGKSVLAFEDAATLAATNADFFVDRSIAVPAGKHRGTFGLAQDGKVVALTSAEMEFAGTLDKDATAVSQLLLANNLYPLTESQMANDPYAFGGVKVIPKGDRTFRQSDELWYFFEMRNPGLAEVALPEGTVPVNPAEAQRLPKVQLKIDVVGTDTTGKPVKMSAPLREADAIPMVGVPGHYGVGSAIPLEKFKPGEYTFTIKAIDTLKKASYTMTEKFTVVE